MDVCECGQKIVHPARGRRRERCEACSPTRAQPKRKAPVLQLTKPTDTLPGPNSSRKSLYQRTLDELTAVARQDSWQGEAALKVAELVDAGGYTAQGASALIKSHREALEVALAGASAKADVIDLIFGAEA